MIYKVVYSPEAENHILALYDYIANHASPSIAKRYLDAVISYCEGLNIFPLRGTQRDDIRQGLRITNYKKRCVIAFSVFDDTVVILGVFYGGQDYEAKMSGEFDA
jgi:toxin ParE1/3/4